MWSGKISRRCILPTFISFLRRQQTNQTIGRIWGIEIGGALTAPEQRAGRKKWWMGQWWKKWRIAWKARLEIDASRPTIYCVKFSFAKITLCARKLYAVGVKNTPKQSSLEPACKICPRLCPNSKSVWIQYCRPCLDRMWKENWRGENMKAISSEIPNPSPPLHVLTYKGSSPLISSQNIKIDLAIWRQSLGKFQLVCLA